MSFWQISADTDRDAVLAWLARYADSPNTLANSRREAERLLLWSLLECGKPLSSLTHEDLLVYQRFEARGLQGFAQQPPPPTPPMSSASDKVTNNGHDSSTGLGLRLGYQPETALAGAAQSVEGDRAAA